MILSHTSVTRSVPFQPDRGAKRSRDEDSKDESRTKHKTSGRDAGRLPVKGEVDSEEQRGGEGERILENLMDQDGEDPEVRSYRHRFILSRRRTDLTFDLVICQGEPVDEGSVKKMILTFEKRSYKNQELRIKFPDNPEKSVSLILYLLGTHASNEADDQYSHGGSQ